MLTRDLTSEALDATPSSVLKILDEQRAEIERLTAELDTAKSIMQHVWDKGMLSITDCTDDEAAKLFANAIGYSYERKYK